MQDKLQDKAGANVLNANQKTVFEYIRDNAPTDILDVKNDILDVKNDILGSKNDILETNRSLFNGEYIAAQLGMPYVTVQRVLSVWSLYTLLRVPEANAIANGTLLSLLLLTIVIIR